MTPQVYHHQVFLLRPTQGPEHVIFCREFVSLQHYSNEPVLWWYLGSAKYCDRNIEWVSLKVKRTYVYANVR